MNTPLVVRRELIEVFHVARYLAFLRIANHTRKRVFQTSAITYGLLSDRFHFISLRVDNDFNWLEPIFPIKWHANNQDQIYTKPRLTIRDAGSSNPRYPPGKRLKERQAIKPSQISLFITCDWVARRMLMITVGP